MANSKVVRIKENEFNLLKKLQKNMGFKTPSVAFSFVFFVFEKAIEDNDDYFLDFVDSLFDDDIREQILQNHFASSFDIKKLRKFKLKNLTVIGD